MVVTRYIPECGTTIPEKRNERRSTNPQTGMQSVHDKVMEQQISPSLNKILAPARFHELGPSDNSLIFNQQLAVHEYKSTSCSIFHNVFRLWPCGPEARINFSQSDHWAVHTYVSPTWLHAKVHANILRLTHCIRTVISIAAEIN